MLYDLHSGMNSNLCSTAHYNDVNSNLCPAAYYDEWQFQGIQATNSDAQSPPPPSPALSSSFHPEPNPPKDSIRLQGLSGPRDAAVALPDPDRGKKVLNEASQLQYQFVRILIHIKIELLRKPVGIVRELHIVLTTLPLSEKFKHLQFLTTEKQRIMNASSDSDIFEILDKH